MYLLDEFDKSSSYGTIQFIHEDNSLVIKCQIISESGHDYYIDAVKINYNKNSAKYTILLSSFTYALIIGSNRYYEESIYTEIIDCEIIRNHLVNVFESAGILCNRKDRDYTLLFVLKRACEKAKIKFQNIIYK